MALERDELYHRYGWFKAEAEKLDDISSDLTCEKKNIDGIHLTMKNAYFSGLQTQYDTLRNAMTQGVGSLQEGVQVVDNYAGAIRRTGRDYLAASAANVDLAAEITKTMDKDGF